MRQTNEAMASGVGGGSCTGSNQPDSVKFNKKLLDYDYGDEEEEDKTTSPHIPNLLDVIFNNFYSRNIVFCFLMVFELLRLKLHMKRHYNFLIFCSILG